MSMLRPFVAQDATLHSRTRLWADTLVGVTVMTIYVVGINRLFWRRLYRLAETRYSLT